jgi:hypothetical protein
VVVVVVVLGVVFKGGEIPATNDGLSSITGGGGFSALWDGQSWQSSAVSSYLALSSIQSQLPPSSTYNANSTLFPPSFVPH